MRRDVQSISENDSVQAAAQKMREFDIGFLPVCNVRGHLTGVVTDRDLALRACADNRSSAATCVAEVMTPEPITCRGKHSLRHAEALMEKHRKSRIVVADAEGKIRGVLSLSDIAQYDRPRRLVRILYAVAARRFAPERP